MSFVPGLINNISRGVASDVVSSKLDINLDTVVPEKFKSLIRGRTLLEGVGGLLSKSTATAKVAASPDEKDWRVRLSVPEIETFSSSKLLEPLKITNNSLIFPLTPTVILSNTASYNAVNPVHSNYTYYNYVNSQADQIVVTGDFVVEDQNDGRYWIAALHYLRSVTKMFYGGEDYRGAPPPIVRLNAYGDYVFNNVPVVISNFTVDMQSDVDYIAVNFSVPDDSQPEVRVEIEDIIENTPAATASQDKAAINWVPTRSTINVTLLPIYSRSTVEQFNLKDFVNGRYVIDGKGFI